MWGSLRKRFRNALVWYNVLQDATTRHIGDALHITCSIAVDLDDGKWHHSVDEEFDKPDPFSSPCEHARHPSPATPDNISPQSSQNIHRAMVEDEESNSDNPVPVGSKQRRDEQEVDEAEQNPFADPLAHNKISIVEGSLCVPNSVLDGCESGFTATDEGRTKASTQFFDDTALMALLCHHDIVLFLTNLCSAGEKQHYVMALVETLFQHLPLKFCLDILYDIGCQVKRSCVKWASLIFIWIEYYLYHQQLYTLDRQVDYACDEIVEGLGTWLLQQSQHALKKHKAAELILQGCGHQEVLLQAQWDAQVATQTKPLPCQSKKAGKDAVNELIRLRETQNDLKKHVKEYNAIITDVDSPPDEYTVKSC
ncbi:hypothetical protein DXG01_016385 [Tephrocybe rancida]|nr:hypothetical protein DXG01_016385 [Tephrocybe rancida]